MTNTSRVDRTSVVNLIYTQTPTRAEQTCIEYSSATYLWFTRVKPPWGFACTLTGQWRRTLCAPHNKRVNGEPGSRPYACSTTLIDNHTKSSFFAFTTWLFKIQTLGVHIESYMVGTEASSFECPRTCERSSWDADNDQPFEYDCTHLTVDEYFTVAFLGLSIARMQNDLTQMVFISRWYAESWWINMRIMCLGLRRPPLPLSIQINDKEWNNNVRKGCEARNTEAHKPGFWHEDCKNLSLEGLPAWSTQINAEECDSVHKGRCKRNLTEQVRNSWKWSPTFGASSQALRQWFYWSTLLSLFNHKKHILAMNRVHIISAHSCTDVVSFKHTCNVRWREVVRKWTADMVGDTF